MTEFLFAIRADSDAKEPCMKILVRAESESNANDIATRQAKHLHGSPRVEKIENDGNFRLENGEEYRTVEYKNHPHRA